MGFDESSENVPPRQAPAPSTFPLWSEPVPKSYKYPWTDLRLPMTRNHQVSNSLPARLCASVEEYVTWRMKKLCLFQRLLTIL